MKSFNNYVLNENTKNLKDALIHFITDSLIDNKIDFYISDIKNFNNKDDNRDLKLELVIDLNTLSKIVDVQNSITKANEFVEENFKVLNDEIGASINRIFLSYTLDRAYFENSNIYKSCLTINKFDL